MTCFGAENETQKNEHRFESKMPQSAYYSMTGYYVD